MSNNKPESAGAGTEPGAQQQGRDASLEEAANLERDYLRNRLKNELQREPTETEVNEWLRQHTEGY